MSGGEVRFVLASASPRRLELLGRLGLEVEVSAPAVDETQLPGEAPPVHAARVAAAKARAVAARFEGCAVLGADTVVTIGGASFGKPRDRAEAARMLAELAGRTHTVLTAVALRFGGREATHLEAASVTMVPYRRDLVDWYVGTGECDDKAGAYAVQGRGAVLVERVEGNVDAVVGLPLAPIPRLLASLGLALVHGSDRAVLRQSP